MKTSYKFTSKDKPYDLTTFNTWSGGMPKKDIEGCMEAKRLVERKAFYCDGRNVKNHKGELVFATEKLPNGTYPLYQTHDECVEDINSLPNVKW